MALLYQSPVDRDQGDTLYVTTTTDGTTHTTELTNREGVAYLRTTSTFTDHARINGQHEAMMHTAQDFNTLLAEPIQEAHP